MFQRPLHRMQPLLMGEWRNDLVHVIHGGIFERSRGIALRIANNGPTRRVRSLAGHAGHPQSHRIGQRHVPVVTVHKNRDIACDRIN
jgi:hypothetical protein